MIAYLDTSALLRLVLREPGAPGQSLTMATHDRDLGLAARSFGIDVLGV